MEKIEIKSEGACSAVYLNGKRLERVSAVDIAIRPRRYNQVTIEFGNAIKKISGVLVSEEFIHEVFCSECEHRIGTFIGKYDAVCPHCGAQVSSESVCSEGQSEQELNQERQKEL